MKNVIIAEEIPIDYDLHKENYLLFGYIKNINKKHITNTFLYNNNLNIHESDYINFEKLTIEFSKSKYFLKLYTYIFKQNKQEISYRAASFLFNPWWIYIIQHYYFLEKNIIDFIDFYKNANINVKVIDICSFKKEFNDTNDFIMNGLLDDNYNHFVFSYILEQIKPKNWNFELVKYEDVNKNEINKFNSIKFYLFNTKQSILNFVFKNTPHFNDISISKLYSINKVFKNIKSHKKNENINFSEKVEYIFKTDFNNYWKQVIPKSFLNKFKNYRDIKGGILFNTNQLYNDNFKQKISFYITKGTPVFSYQHGGHNYGTGNINKFFVNEYFLSDYFIKWGSYNLSDISSICINLPSPKFELRNKKYKFLKNKIIWISTHNLINFFRFDSNIKLKNTVRYIDLKEYFFNLINQDKFLSKSFIYRPYIQNKASLNDIDLFKEKFQSINYFTKNSMKLNYLYNTSLVILDHPGTTLNFTFSNNIPTICFWEDNFYSFSEEAKELFNLMIEHKLLINDPDILYDFIRSTDISSWWRTNQIQNIISIFNKTYANKCEKWVKVWENNLIY